MADPVLHLVAGPNGAGKSTLFDLVLGPATGLPFVNADVLAADRWPDDAVAHAYDAAALAADQRARLLADRRSFVTETVFSHPSKVDLVATAVDAGYLVTLHVVLVPEELAVARVRSRVASGGHAVPVRKIRSRYRRLWPLVARAAEVAETTVAYDNSRAPTPFRVVATLHRGVPVGTCAWPTWTPDPLSRLDR